MLKQCYTYHAILVFCADRSKRSRSCINFYKVWKYQGRHNQWLELTNTPCPPHNILLPVVKCWVIHTHVLLTLSSPCNIHRKLFRMFLWRSKNVWMLDKSQLFLISEYYTNNTKRHIQIYYRANKFDRCCFGLPCCGFTSMIVILWI